MGQRGIRGVLREGIELCASEVFRGLGSKFWSGGEGGVFFY